MVVILILMAVICILLSTWKDVVAFRCFNLCRKVLELSVR